MSRALLAAVAGACLSLTACAQSASDRAAHDATVAASERKPDLLYQRGLAFAQVGDLTRSEQYLVASLDAGEPSSKVLPKLMDVCVANTHYRAAIEYARPELQRNPDNSALRFVVSELEAYIGDVVAAHRDLDVVTAAEPSEPAPHFAYGRLLRDSLNDRMGADREFRAYLALAPTGEHANEARTSLVKTVTVVRVARAKEVRRP